MAGLCQLGEVSASAGVVILLEPLNHYEDHMVNTRATARDLAAATGLSSVQVGTDSCHMNIEEADIQASLRATADRIGHVQLSDSNRLEPVAGHLDWAALLATLGQMHDAGTRAFECRLSGDAADVLRRVVRLQEGAKP